MIRGSDRVLATASDHSPLDARSGPMRVTSGKSRVGESRPPGSVREKPNGRATQPRPGGRNRRKAAIAPRQRARTLPGQQGEAAIAVEVLNYMI